VAVNKIDRIPGWKPQQVTSFLKSYASQDPYVKENVDNRLYEVMGAFSREGFNTNRFDQIKDFTSTIALVPTSAKTGEGMTELMMVLVGLAQQFLKKRLQTTEGPAKGSVLEVKEEPGLGLTLNSIIYDGTLEKDDLIVVGGKEKPIVTHIRTILVPKPLDEIRDPRDRFSSVNRVFAAAGVKVVASDLEGALAGAPLYAVPSGADPEKYVKLVAEELKQIRIATDVKGIVLKADTLGSLEAIAEMLKQNNVPVRIADVGDVSKRDVVEASVVKTHEPLFGAVLAFNTKVLPDAEEEAANADVQVFKDKIIYNLIDTYLDWLKSQREAKSEMEFEKLVKPGKILVMPGYVFRRAKPAIFGLEILGGQLKPKYSLIRAEDGADVGVVQQIQDKGKAISEATQGMQVAASMDKPIVGRHVFEKDILYVKVTESDAKTLMESHKDKLSDDDQAVLMEYVKIMQKRTPFWGGF
jgi:translation initiation factor 5B